MWQQPPQVYSRVMVIRYSVHSAIATADQSYRYFSTCFILSQATASTLMIWPPTSNRTAYGEHAAAFGINHAGVGRYNGCSRRW